MNGVHGEQLLGGADPDAHGAVVVVLGVGAENADDVEVEAVQRAVGSVQENGRVVAGLQLQGGGDAFAEEDSVGVLRVEVTARQDHHRSLLDVSRGLPGPAGSVVAQPGLFFGIDAFADDGEIRLAVVQEAGKVETRQDVLNVRQPFQALERGLGVGNHVLERRAAAEAPVSGVKHLDVAQLRMDGRLAQLQEDVFDESSRQDDPGAAEGNCRQRQSRPDFLTKDVAQGEAKHKLSANSSQLSAGAPRFVSGLKAEG